MLGEYNSIHKYIYLGEGGIKIKDLYKKIDKSFFKYGTTIPKENVESFLFNTPINMGSSRNVNLVWHDGIYPIKLCYTRPKSPVYQLRWASNNELLVSLKKEFIQTYVAIESQNYKAKEDNKYYITKLMGGNQEVAILKPIDINTIKFETFIKIETPYDDLFKRLVDNNVFGWIQSSNATNLITKSTAWIDKTDLSRHVEEVYVIYYLIDDLNKHIYIGSAERLGDRVKLNRDVIPNWNRFRYEIVHPDFHFLLRQIEYISIMNFARFFTNQGNLSSLNLSDYILINKDYKYYLK